MRLADKVAIVTGATSGIGRAIATVFASAGARVIVSGRSADRGRAVVDEIVSAGGAAAYVQADLSDTESIRKLVDLATSTYGRLDILVNNAAQFGLANYLPLADTPIDEWDATLSVNLRAVFVACKFALPGMCAQGGGSIVNISSIGGLTAFPRYAAYVASKGALNQLTRSIALDYGRFNIRANLVCPGAIDTPGNDPFIEAFYDSREAYVEAVSRQAPLGRIGSPEDVAYAALYLASPEAAYVSGACIVVDGGRLAGG